MVEGPVDIMFVYRRDISVQILDRLSPHRIRRRFHRRLQHVITRRLAIDFLVAVAGQHWSEVFRGLENVLVEGPALPVLIVKPKPVARHETLTSVFRQNVLLPVWM